MSKVVGFIIGATLIVAGLLTGNPGLIIQGAAMVVTQAVVDLTMPKTPARQAAEMTLQLGEQPRCALFGETFTAGSLVDAFNFGGKYGTNWEVLIIRLADHKCEGLTGFYVNDVYVPYVGDGVYPQFNGHSFQLFFRADTNAVGLPGLVFLNKPDWSVNDQGQSGCDVIVGYLADEPDAKHVAWPGGRPHFGFVVKGKKCYDPRKDSSVDGSGDHRWDDPSTWEWTDNAAVCRYNWVRGIYANDQVNDPSQLLVGRGLTAIEAPPANIFAAANLCDELVDGEPRYRVAGPVYANQDYIDVEQQFAIATAGSVVTREGSVELEPGAAKSIVATITDADILSGSRITWNHRVPSEASSDWVNTVVARYVEPTQMWADHAAPVVRDQSDILLDGRPREASVPLRMVRHQGQALRVAEILRRLGRLWGRATVTLGPRFCELEDGDWIRWQSDRYGFDLIFRVEAYSISADWKVALTLREMQAAVFNDDGEFDPDYSVAIPTTPPPDIGAPEAANWTLTAIALDSGGSTVPALRFEGDASDDDLASAIIFEYWQDDGVTDPLADPDAPIWITVGTLPRSTTQLDVSSVTGGATYYGAVTYIVDGVRGDRLVLGPVTVPVYAVSGLQLEDSFTPLHCEDDSTLIELE